MEKNATLKQVIPGRIDYRVELRHYGIGRWMAVIIDDAGHITNIKARSRKKLTDKVVNSCHGKINFVQYLGQILAK